MSKSLAVAVFFLAGFGIVFAPPPTRPQDAPSDQPSKKVLTVKDDAVPGNFDTAGLMSWINFLNNSTSFLGSGSQQPSTSGSSTPTNSKEAPITAYTPTSTTTTTIKTTATTTYSTVVVAGTASSAPTLDTSTYSTVVTSTATKAPDSELGYPASTLPAPPQAWASPPYNYPYPTLMQGGFYHQYQGQAYPYPLLAASVYYHPEHSAVYLTKSFAKLSEEVYTNPDNLPVVSMLPNGGCMDKEEHTGMCIHFRSCGATGRTPIGVCFENSPIVCCPPP